MDSVTPMPGNDFVIQGAPSVNSPWLPGGARGNVAFRSRRHCVPPQLFAKLLGLNGWLGPLAGDHVFMRSDLPDTLRSTRRQRKHSDDCIEVGADSHEPRLYNRRLGGAEGRLPPRILFFGAIATESDLIARHMDRHIRHHQSSALLAQTTAKANGEIPSTSRKRSFFFTAEQH